MWSSCVIVHPLFDLYERVDLAIAEIARHDAARIQELELEDEREGDNLGAGLLDEAAERHRRAAGRDEVVDDEHLVAGNEGVFVDLQLIGAVLERIGLGVDLARKLARLARGDEADAELVGDGRTDEEAAGLGADDLGDALVGEMRGDVVDERRERLRVLEQRRDVLEDDARLGLIGDVDDLALEIVIGHGASFHRSL